MKGTGIPNNIIEDSSGIKWMLAGTLASGQSLSWVLEEKPDDIFLQGLDTPVSYYSVIISGFQAKVSDTERTDYRSNYNTWYITNSNYDGYFYWNETSKTLEARSRAQYGFDTSAYKLSDGSCDYMFIKYKRTQQ